MALNHSADELVNKRNSIRSKKRGGQVCLVLPVARAKDDNGRYSERSRMTDSKR